MIFIALVSCHTDKEEKTIQFAYPIDATTPKKARTQAHFELNNGTYEDRGFFVGDIVSLITYTDKLTEDYAKTKISSKRFR